MIFEYDDLIKRVKNYISSNAEMVNLSEVAEYAGYSSKQLNRIFARKTGITVGEYIRFKRLAQAVMLLKFSDKSIIEVALSCGYESQESFTRSFSSIFHMNPGEFRNRGKLSELGVKGKLYEIIEETSHEAANNGIYISPNIRSWIITKPERKWLSIHRNTKNLFPHDFYVICEKEGYYKRLEPLTESLMTGGAYLTHRYLGCRFDSLTLGAEVPADYNTSILAEFLVTEIPSSKYVVFNAPPYSCEELGGSVKAAWNAYSNFDYSFYNLKLDMNHAPIFEEDSKEFGYTLYFPVCEK